MNTRRLPASLALITMVVSISACGSNAPSNPGNGSGSGGSHTVVRAQKVVRFAECMRHNGVSQFPDPASSGSLTLDGIVNGSSLDPNTPAFQQAIRACSKLEPAGFMGAKRSKLQTQAALKFAQCVRENGVKDFPDPANGQPLIDTNLIPSAATASGMSSLRAAMQKCHVFGAAAIGRQP